MRKGVKAQLQKSAEYLAQTAGGLTELLGRTRREEAVDILAQMQNLAVEVGNTIEDQEGEQACREIIRELEGACELLYQLSCSLDDSETAACLAGKLKTAFLGIKETIERDIAVKREVLFLPYQVSMWDALESIWMAAKEDAGTKCYVVPVPFYDVGPDNSLGKLHYEGDRYPKYVPVTPYWEYSVEERRPDVIFIHNPYDECNRVTRVPEKYYARKLKPYTEKLVYVPYFVSEDWGPSDGQCCLPGVLFSDRVIVQPGRIYEKYSRIYTDILKQNGWENILVPAKEKFLPLGSPKFDKVGSKVCGVEEVPESWRKIIERPDGSRKKVILYNLSIGPLLRDRERVIKKLDSVFGEFRKYQEDVVVLWRPHPLLPETIEAMVPRMRDAYKERIRQFKEEGWGIYDDTPDPNLAMAVSDGYYGDWSSLVTTYRETGKPILIQNSWMA